MKENFTMRLWTPALRCHIRTQLLLYLLPTFICVYTIDKCCADNSETGSYVIVFLFGPL